MDPAKRRSPENISSETSCCAYGVRNVTEPSVWPGVWSTTNRSPASSSSARSDSSRTSSGSAHE